MLEKINALLSEVPQWRATTAEEVEQLRVKYLSKKGIVSTLMDEFRTVPAADKKAIGMHLNALKSAITDRLSALRTAVDSASASSAPADDLTRSAYPLAVGTRHPLTTITNEIVDIFHRMGFILATGPEIDDDLNIFTNLNFAADHPARDMQDTFFVHEHPSDVTKNVLLRSHTSNDQSHYLCTHEPPVRVLCPGRVYRNEAVSARVHCFFHQVEGLYVDKNVSFVDLKQVLLTFAREMFGASTKMRLRPSYFPFTEPSAEMDISCHLCGGKGCHFCKERGWVEILGCGMVDPNVLTACGVDSSVYTGFAFGMGVERIANLKYRVSDLRLFSENDVRFLGQFQTAH